MTRPTSDGYDNLFVVFVVHCVYRRFDVPSSLLFTYTNWSASSLHPTSDLKCLRKCRPIVC